MNISYNFPQQQRSYTFLKLSDDKENTLYCKKWMQTQTELNIREANEGGTRIYSGKYLADTRCQLNSTQRHSISLDDHVSMASGTAPFSLRKPGQLLKLPL
jgi:hypothetical protein